GARVTSGSLPPTPSRTRAGRAIAAAQTFAPGACERVNDTPSMPGCLTMAPPTPPRPNTMLNTPAGTPDSYTISASAAAVAGVGPAGLITTVLPNASAGADFHEGIAIGKFQGVINPNTPTGSRDVLTSTPG